MMLRSRSVVPAALAAAFVLVGKAQVATSQAGTISPPDHFTCYKVKIASGSEPLAPFPAQVADQFRSSRIVVQKLKQLCAPTNKNGEDASAPSHPDHLVGYQIRPALRFPPVANQKVVDQFNPNGLFLDVKRPAALLVPAAKSRTQPPPAPVAPVVDHFTCYKAAITNGTPGFVRQRVTLEDQFGALTVDVQRPTRLCLPTNKNDEAPGTETHPDRLMCYRIKQTGTPRFLAVPNVYTRDQFGSRRFDARMPAELCMPAL